MYNAETLHSNEKPIRYLENALKELRMNVDNNVIKKDIKSDVSHYEDDVNKLLDSSELTSEDKKSISELEGDLKAKRESEAIDHEREEASLKATMEEIVSKFGSSIKQAFDTLVTKPAKWMIETIKENPGKTILVILAIAGLWYYSGPIEFGMSAIPEKGMEIVSDVLTKSLGPAADLPSVNSYLNEMF